MPRGEKTTAKDAERLNSLQRTYSEEITELKHRATVRRTNRKYSQEMVGRVYGVLLEYVEDCYKKKQPLTVAGMQLKLGIMRDAWYRAGEGELDHLLEEYIIDNNITDDDIRIDQEGLPWFDGENGPVLLLQWSELRKKADLLIQDQLERNCYTNRGNPAGSIFGLKAQFNWKEDEGPQHLVQQLVIADLDQAKKALEMLK